MVALYAGAVVLVTMAIVGVVGYLLDRTG